jgi:glyoxylate reductase
MTGETASPSVPTEQKELFQLTRQKVFVTRRRVPDAIALLEKHFDVDVWEESTPPPDEVLIQKVKECDGILTEFDDKIYAAIMEQAGALKVIGNRAVGMDNLDVPTATRKGIVLSNTPGVLHESCADLAFGLMLALARNIAFGDRQIRAGEWKMFNQVPYIGTDVWGATLGVVGMGAIGYAVARRARGFGMKVIYSSRTRKAEWEQESGIEHRPDMDAVLREADFVSVHVALTPDTYHVIGAKQLAMMKPDAFLINTSRGGTVDPDSLYDALSSGRLAGAALDVTEPEPIPFDSPLLKLDNVVFTPHIASATKATFRRMGMLAAENIVAALTGKPMPTPVNPQALQNR